MVLRAQLHAVEPRPYRSSTRAALTANCGSRGKIHDRNCHGLIAAACSQRRTVEDEIDSTSPSVVAWTARSVELHRDNGTCRCSGRSHAIALMPATTSSPKRRGRPDRGRSRKPASPSAQKRASASAKPRRRTRRRVGRSRRFACHRPPATRSGPEPPRHVPSSETRPAPPTPHDPPAKNHPERRAARHQAHPPKLGILHPKLTPT